MKTFLRVAVLLGFCSAPASAAIIVNSIISDSGAGVRAQGVIENSTRGDDPLGVAVKEFRGTIIVRDNVSPPDSGGGPGLIVKKSNLSAQQAWGQGLALGYAAPPFTDPEGPWQGLTWPYRDQYDYFNQGDPLADDVGTPFFDDPDVYGFVNIVGIARGGPTEPDIPPPGMPTPQWLDRGLTGNGLDGPATYFNFDIIPLSGDLDRFVRVRVVAASAVVVQRDAQGVYSEIEIEVPDSRDFFIQLPEPGSATLATIGLGMILSRRRRK